MSQASKEDPQAAADTGEPEQRGHTVQMNPAMLGQAANMNPASDVVKQLDAASQLLENATDEDECEVSDQSIEDYMAALIARTRDPSDKSGEPLPPLASAFVDSKDADLEGEIADPKAEAADAVEEAPRPPSPPPECRDAISELRELANINARSSFNVHKGQQLVYQMHNKLVVSLVALVVSFALTALATNTRSPACFAAIAALVIAMLWTSKYFQLGRQLRRLCSKGKDTAD